MSIGKIFGIGATVTNGVFNYVKKNPKTVLTATGLTGAVALIALKAATAPKKQVSDQINQLHLINPYLNPIGWVRHVLNPLDTNPGAFDTPIVKYLIDKDNESEVIENKSDKNLNYALNMLNNIQKNNHVAKVIKADDGGSIDIYVDKYGNNIGSINKDPNGYIRNLCLDDCGNGQSISCNFNNDKITSIYKLPRYA